MFYQVQLVVKDGYVLRPGRYQADQPPKVDVITVELLTDHLVVGGSQSCQARVTRVTEDDKIIANEI
jgi:hypothetical protein